MLLRVTSGNQFGLDEAEVERLVSHRENYPNIDIHGIQCYTGTQKKKIDHITKELEWLDGICDMLKEKYGFKVVKTVVEKWSNEYPIEFSQDTMEMK